MLGKIVFCSVLTPTLTYGLIFLRNMQRYKMAQKFLLENKGTLDKICSKCPPGFPVSKGTIILMDNNCFKFIMEDGNELFFKDEELKYIQALTYTYFYPYVKYIPLPIHYTCSKLFKGAKFTCKEDSLSFISMLKEFEKRI